MKLRIYVNYFELYHCTYIYLLINIFKTFRHYNLCSNEFIYMY